MSRSLSAGGRRPRYCLCGRFTIRPGAHSDLRPDQLSTGCSVVTQGGVFAPGHDAKLKNLLVDAVFEGAESLLLDLSTYPGSGLDAARSVSDKFALAVAKMVDKRMHEYTKRHEEHTSGLTRSGETRATRAVFRALAAPDGQRNSWEPIGASFGAELDVYVTNATAWLRDKSSLSTSSIEGADWVAIRAWYIDGEAL